MEGGGGAWGRRKLCMVPCHSCNVFRTWRSKEVGRGEILKSSVGGIFFIKKNGKLFFSLLKMKK